MFQNVSTEAVQISNEMSLCDTFTPQQLQQVSNLKELVDGQLFAISTWPNEVYFKTFENLYTVKHT